MIYDNSGFYWGVSTDIYISEAHLFGPVVLGSLFRIDRPNRLVVFRKDSCDVTGSVTLSDRDRGVTVPDRRGFSPEINPVCFRFMSSMRVPRSVISCGEMVRVPSRHSWYRRSA